MNRQSMNRQHIGLAMTAAAVSLLLSNSILAQSKPGVAGEPPPAAKASRVHITQGPELESTDDGSAIISWRSNNPGGADEHYGIVHYGTNPTQLSQTAKSHIRLNRNHSYTVFRVQLDGLAPRTTYYYIVDSMEPSGRSDGVKSPVKKFTTAGSDERVAAQPAQPAPPQK